MMTREQYLIEAARTCPNLSNKLEDKIHMILGIIDEESEWVEARINSYIDDPNEILIKEDGDRWWYFANLCRITGNEYIFIRNPMDAILHTGRRDDMFKLAGIYKKELAYNKESDLDTVVFLLHGINEYLSKSTHDSGLELSKVLERNIQKLRARFPDKFDQQLAINKDESRE